MALLTFEVVTLFPELFDSFLATSLLGKAIETGLIAVHFTDPREHTTDKHRSVDDAPYGGGAGMVMRAPPVVAAIEQAIAARGPAHRILLTPAGRPLTQARVRELAALPRVLLVCGRYEGIDDRVRALAIDEELSLGDFVLSGGEPAAIAVIDAIARHVPGVLGDAASAEEESFEGGVLEYPHYTRPPEFRGHAVPEVLVGGHHEKVRAWRREQAERRTRERRPELLPPPSPARAYVALVHHPVVDRSGRIVTTAITNLDIHDIARATRTFGLAGYFVVTPIDAQQQLAARIVGHWTEGEGRDHNDKRSEALASVRVVAALEDARDAVTSEVGAAPRLVFTSARRRPGAIPFHALRGTTGPLLLVFGTGWGLAEPAFALADAVLEPIQGGAEYNHLSVRSAVAIVLDRLFGR